ncbi:MAG: chorismate mutase [Firmicutes bacterium]|nr:chorismate mutase [Bacillota bacterium]
MIILVRGVRGAISVDKNEPIEILERVEELLVAMVQANKIQTEDIASITFSSTADLNAAFPALAARKLGWIDVPLFGTLEIDCPTGLPRCIRALILLNTDLPQNAIKHIYLREAVILRPDVRK